MGIAREARRMVRSVPPAAASSGQDIDSRVQDLFTALEGSPSLIGNAVMAAMVEVIEDTPGNPDREAVRGAVMCGYWLREYAERDGIEVPSFPLPPRLPLTPAGGIDYDRWGDQGAELQEARLGVLEGSGSTAAGTRPLDGWRLR
jgi:hypothetical protein